MLTFQQFILAMMKTVPDYRRSQQERRMVRSVRRRVNRLNRSPRWAYADSYKAARALAPDPYQPVR